MIVKVTFFREEKLVPWFYGEGLLLKINKSRKSNPHPLSHEEFTILREISGIGMKQMYSFYFEICLWRKIETNIP